jgi:asparagine synthase (glutamine-hydrolysing)
MICQYKLNDPKITLNSDLAAEFPIYIYYCKTQSTFIYSNSITELLKSSIVIKPLSICDEGLSFLLQSGIVPPPKTVYKNIFILGCGDKVIVSTFNNLINLEFSHSFPFLSSNRKNEKNYLQDENLILKMLAENVISRIDKSNPAYLFHSAGKDSNFVALALAEAGWQDRVTLVCHKNKNTFDESNISSNIANRLGFKHKILYQTDNELNPDQKKLTINYFINAPFPCVDNVAMTLPHYVSQLPQLQSANIIDGGGNDIYMTIPPTVREKIIIPLSKYFSRASYFRTFFSSESLFSCTMRTPAEWCGMSGFTFDDTKKIFSNAINVFSYWKKESNLKNQLDLFDFKTSILCPLIASEMHIRKMRNFADAINANFILPFANKNIAEYIFNLPENYLFDRKTLKNKIFFRKVLKDRIDLDSDKIGKRGWGYNGNVNLINNLNFIKEQILSCSLWQPFISKLLERLIYNIYNVRKNDYISRTSRSLIIRLYLISSWHTLNKFIRTK